MKALYAIFAVVAVFAVMTIGSGNAFARSYPMNQPTTPPRAQVGGNCSLQFGQMDVNGTGQLSYEQFKANVYGSGGHKGISPSGNASNMFASADTNNDGFLSHQEYCNWKNRP